MPAFRIVEIRRVRVETLIDAASEDEADTFYRNGGGMRVDEELLSSEGIEIEADD